MTITEFTVGQFRDKLLEFYGPYTNDVLRKVNRWLARGDGAAVYQNAVFDSIDFGELRVLSFGSSQSQLPQSQFPQPPVTLPDFPDQINWRFQLAGTYRGDPVPDV